MARGQKATPRSSWGDERKKNQATWQKEHRTKLAADVSRETADRFRSYCAEHGTTVSALLSSYIYSLIGRPGEDQETGEASGDLDQETGGDRSRDGQTTADAATVSGDQTGAGSIDQGGPATASQRDQTGDREGKNETPGTVGLPTANDTPGTVGIPENSSD